MYLNGDVNLERDIKSVKVNAPLESLIEVPATLVSIPEQQPDPLSRQELSEGVWLIGGNGTYSFCITNSTSNSVFYASKEDGAQPAAELVIETAN